MKNDEKVNKKIITIITVIYMIILVWVVVFKCNYNEGLHIETNRTMTILERLNYKAIPFEKFIEAIKGGGVLAVVEMIALVFNVVCFLPFGAFLRFFTDKKWKIVAIGALASLGIETFQLFSCWGGPDLIDLVSNTLGVIVGICMYDSIAPKLSGKTINNLAFWGSVVIFPFMIFAVINSIINFPGF